MYRWRRTKGKTLVCAANDITNTFVINIGSSPKLALVFSFSFTLEISLQLDTSSLEENNQSRN